MPSLTRRRLLGTGAAAAAGGVGVELLAGPAPTFEAWEPAAGAWPAERRDSARTAAAPEMTPPTAEPSVEWTAEVESAPNEGVTALVVGDGTAFLGGDFRVAAVDLADGSRLWDADAPAEHLCYRGGVLYCAGTIYRGGLTALDAADDGQKRWEVSGGDSADVYDVLVAGDTALVGTHYGLRAHDLRNGERTWELDVGGGRVRSAVASGTLFVGGPGPLAKYRSREGWDAVRKPTPRRAERAGPKTPGHVAHPVVTDDTVYVGGYLGVSEDTTVSAVSRGTLEHRWHGPKAMSFTSPVPIDGDGVVRAYHYDDRDSDYELLGVDLDDGRMAWRIGQNAKIAPPVGAGDLAFTCSADGAVLAVDPETGRVVWETTVGGVPIAVVPADDRLLVADASGTVRCLR